MMGKRWVQKRAAAAGVISSAAMSTTPTVWMPMATANTVKSDKAASNQRTGKPMASACARSNNMSFHGRYSMNTAVINTTANAPKVTTSRHCMPAALPKRK